MSEEVTEEWKPVVGYEGLYEVSNMGRVRKLRSGKIATLTKKNPQYGGYFVVTLIKYIDGKRSQKTANVHRLVAEAFIPNPDHKPCVDHINTDPTDNRIENLRWSTYLENNRNPITWERHLAAHRTQEYHDKVTSPERKAMAKSPEHITKCRAGSRWHMKPVMCVETGEIWESIQEAHRATGILASVIGSACRRAEDPNYKPMKIQSGKVVRHFRFYKQNNSNQGE